MPGSKEMRVGVFQEPSVEGLGLGCLRPVRVLGCLSRLSLGNISTAISSPKCHHRASQQDVA